MNWELPDVQAGFRRGRRIRDQIANIHWIMEKAREFQKISVSASLTMLKPLCEYMCTQSCLTHLWLHGLSLPSSSVHGILQAKILEWVAVPPPGDLPDSGIKHASLGSPESPALAGGFFTTVPPWLCGSQQTEESSERDGSTRPPYPPYLSPEKPVCGSRSNSCNWTWSNWLIPAGERSTTKLFIVTLLI